MTAPTRLCTAFREFGGMHAEIFPDFQLHSVDFRQKTRYRSMVVFGIRFNVPLVRDLPLEFCDAVKRNI